MNENIAPPALRYMIRALRAGTGLMGSLANINTTELPDGAACYVIEDSALWILDKTSTAAFIAGQVVTPGSGPGRWLYFGGSAALSPPAEVDGSGTNTWTANGNWGISGTSNVALLAGFPAGWALTALGSILTYSGTPRRFLAQFSATFEVGNADALREVFAAVSHNDDLTGAASLGGGRASIDIGVVAQGLQVTAKRIIVVADGDTIRPKAAVASAATSLSSTSQCLIVTPL